MRGKGRWDDRRRGAQEPAACVEGRLRTRGWPGHLLFMSSSEWEGNGVSHDARKDVKLTADATARIARRYSDITEGAGIYRKRDVTAATY